MPGQRKRKRKRQQREERAGHWEVVFNTQDEAEWLAFKHRFLSGREAPDPSMIRVDIFCGRLAQPTGYQLSLFVPA
jgi:hypothetical protein